MQSTPATRTVLLGASNLHRGLSLGIRLLAQASAPPVEAWVAAGRGRSFGAPSRFAFVRRLPGIVESPLWQEVAALPSLLECPLFALVSDVGNDLLYGAPVQAILGWVATCLERLEAVRARTVLTLLPLARLERLTPLQFTAFAALFYPGRKASWEETLDRARELDAGLAELAGSRGVTPLAPPLEWYGFDPIHIRRDRRGEAWMEVLRAWGLAGGPSPLLPPGRTEPESVEIRTLPRVGGVRISRETRLFGLPCRWPQPALRCRDGSRAFLL